MWLLRLNFPLSVSQSPSGEEPREVKTRRKAENPHFWWCCWAGWLAPGTVLFLLGAACVTVERGGCSAASHTPSKPHLPENGHKTPSLAVALGTVRYTTESKPSVQDVPFSRHWQQQLTLCPGCSTSSHQGAVSYAAMYGWVPGTLGIPRFPGRHGGKNATPGRWMRAARFSVTVTHRGGDSVQVTRKFNGLSSLPRGEESSDESKLSLTGDY